MSSDLQEINALIQRIRDGSQDAAREFLQRYGSYILHVIRRQLDKKLRSKFDSMDFLQDVCASFFTNPSARTTFDSPEALVNFLTLMARNKVVEAARQCFFYHKQNVNREWSLNVCREEAEDVPAPCPTPSEAVSREEEWDRLLAGRPAYQQCILTMLRQGHTHQEIASTLGVNEKTVRRLIQRLALELAP